uniref:OCRE domain-containing protein n=1 Tax=Chlamydomonas chlamydogama TaxID=225041 RepID=A0A7S2VV17_9CHLO
MAQVKRQANRKEKKAAEDDTDMGGDVEGYEKDTLDVDEEDGVKFEPFNLKEERETGYFDESGNYVEKREGREDRDAWLTSDEAKVVSEEVRRKIEQRQKAEAAAEASMRQVPLTDRQIAQLKHEIAQSMQAGETIAKTLKRVGGAAAGAAGHAKAMGKREKARLAAQQQGNGQHGQQAGAALFSRLTEIADQLVAEGEMDVYTATKEELERSAAIWLPKQPAAQPPVVGSGPGPTGAVAAAAGAADDDDDDDMFAEQDQKPSAAAAAQAPAATAAAAPTAPAVAAAAAAAPAAASAGSVPQAAPSASQPQPQSQQQQQQGTDFSSWPIKELKRYLQEHGVDPSRFVEKSDLAARAGEVEAAAAAESAAQAAVFSAPPGYVFDPSTGYFQNAETGLYFDGNTGAYYNGSTGQWLHYDPSSGELVPWSG